MPKITQLPCENAFMWSDLAEMRKARLRLSDLPGLISWLRWGSKNPDAAGLPWRLQLCQSLIRALPSSQRIHISKLILRGDIPGMVEAALIPARESDRAALASLWRIRDRLLAVPGLWSGLLEGHPLGMRTASPTMMPILGHLTNIVVAHAAEGIAALRLVDRAIIYAWGFPVMKKAWSTSLAQLEKAGLVLEVFDD